MATVDPKWIAVDSFTTGTLDHDTTVVVPAIDRIAAAGLPPIACAPVQAKLMALTAYAAAAKNALEIGTCGGLTAIRLALANSQLHVTTIELHEVYANVAKENIAAAGLADRIEVLVGPAVEILKLLTTEIEQGNRERFDLAFIDADSVSVLSRITSI
jgi:predicted O-methyltransferase YrrM